MVIRSKAFYEGVKAGATHERLPNPYEECSKDWWDWIEGNSKAYELFTAEEIIQDLTADDLDGLLGDIGD